MSVGLKIVLFAVNLFCLIATLIAPSDITAIALLPCWISAGYWLYEKISSNEHDSAYNIHEKQNTKKNKFIMWIKKHEQSILRGIFLIFFFVFVIMVIGFACLGIFYQYDTSANQLIVKEGVVLPFEVKILYRDFQCWALIFYLILSLFEIAMMLYKEYVSAKQDNCNECTEKVTDIVNKKCK